MRDVKHLLKLKYSDFSYDRFNISFNAFYNLQLQDHAMNAISLNFRDCFHKSSDESIEEVNSSCSWD